MAKGDVKSVASKSSGRAYSYGHTTVRTYNDEGRGTSEDIWEQFEKAVKGMGEVGKVWMFQIDDAGCNRLVRYSTYRYGLMDILRYMSDRDNADYAGFVTRDDSRAKRLVVAQYGLETWIEFHRYVCDGNDRHHAKQEEEQKQRNEQMAAHWKQMEEEREAEKVKIEEADHLAVAKSIELVIGAIQADFAEVFGSAEIYHQVEGDWLDDAVDAYRTGMGFGVEHRTPDQIKLQVTVSLDLSNSMYYNRIHKAASVAFREIGMALNELKEMYAGSLYTAYFTFSEDGWSEGKGKRAGKLKANDGASGFDEFESFKPSSMERWYGTGIFSGEDTYTTPLFQAIEKWETEESDPGAVRLDLVITDAVLEHKADIIASSVVQERRDGALQTIFLNLMPETEWNGGTLPRRCVQYPVNKDNISGMLRQILREFIGAQL